MNRSMRFLLGMLLLAITSCGARKARMGGTPVEDAAVTAIVEKHYANEVDFETLQGRLNVNYQNEDREQNVTVSFRMKKDDTIWMSGQLLGIPLAKVLITPSSVQFYEKITQTYFDGDFRLLSDILGTPLDFQKVQNLLLGQAIYDLRKEPYSLVESERGYQLKPVTDSNLKKLFLLDTRNFRILAQQLGQVEAGRGVTISYPEYQKFGDQEFPGEILIVASDGPENTKLDLAFKSLEFDVPVRFPFSIPSGYEEIIVE